MRYLIFAVLVLAFAPVHAGGIKSTDIIVNDGDTKCQKQTVRDTH